MLSLTLLTALHFPKPGDPSFNTFHGNTLLDGELVNDTVGPDGAKKLRYLVFDCVVLDGEQLMNKALDKRIGRYFQFVDKPLKNFYAKHPEDAKSFAFEVMFKAMDKPYALEEMFNHKLPNLPHGNDGLVFTCKGTTYVSGTDEHILKWKPAHENSIDFKLALGQFPITIFEDGTQAEDFDAKPSFDLLVFHGNDVYQPFASLYITDADWEAMKSLGQQLDGRIIECYKDPAFNGAWRFKAEDDGSPRFRDDKTTANHISTVKKVLESIEDGVTQDELIAAAPVIMRTWKKRHPEESQGTPQPPPPQAHPQPPTWRRSESISGPQPGMNGRLNGH
jgi:mRNA guanylyltransferase